MKTICAVHCGLILILSACSQTPAYDDVEDHHGIVQMYLDGTLKAAYLIAIHPNPQAGQYWETACEAYGYVTRERWQVASVDGSKAVVEHHRYPDSPHAMFDYVRAFEVNLDAPVGDANVLRAWIGKSGRRPAPIQVMAAAEHEPLQDPTGAYELVAQDFAGLELAGRQWIGTVTTVVGEDWTSKYWTADHGWFNGVIKQELDGSSIELTAFGDDAKPLLDW